MSQCDSEAGAERAAGTSGAAEAERRPAVAGEARGEATAPRRFR